MVDQDPEVAAFVRERLGRMSTLAIAAEALERFGAQRAPKKTAIWNYWRRLHGPASTALSDRGRSTDLQRALEGRRNGVSGTVKRSASDSKKCGSESRCEPPRLHEFDSDSVFRVCPQRDEVLFNIEMALSKEEKLWPKRCGPDDHDRLKPMARAILEHLELCGLRFFRKPPAPKHSTPDLWGGAGTGRDRG